MPFELAHKTFHERAQKPLGARFGDQMTSEDPRIGIHAVCGNVETCRFAFDS